MPNTPGIPELARRVDETNRRLEDLDAKFDAFMNAAVIHRLIDLERRLAVHDRSWSWLLRTVFASVFLAFLAALIVQQLT